MPLSVIGLLEPLIFFGFVGFVLWLIFGKRKKTKTAVIDGKKVKIEENSEPPKQRVFVPQFLTIGLLLAVVAFNAFIYGTEGQYGGVPVVGTFLFHSLYVVAMLLTFPKGKRTPLVWATAAVSVLSAAALSWRANGFVQGINLATMGITATLLLLLRTFEKVHWHFLWLLKYVLALVPFEIKQIWYVLKHSSPVKTASGIKQKKSFGLTVVKTGFLSLIALIVFAGILSSADPVFAQIIEEFMEEIVPRSIWSILVVIQFLIVVTMFYRRGRDRSWTLDFFSTHDLFFPTATVVILMAIFLGVQVQYLFGSNPDFAAYGIESISEYVRRGFTELLVAATIGGLLAYVVAIKSRVIESVGKLRQLQIVNVALIVELFFLLVSALKRDLLYVETYGLTRVRVVGGLFLVWLAGALIVLLAFSLSKKMLERYLLTAFAVLGLVFWAGVNIINVDARVAAGTPGHHEYVDHFYINNLSEDGVDGWVASVPALREVVDDLTNKEELTDVEKSQIAGTKLAIISLQERRNKLYLKYADVDWLVENYDKVGLDGVPSYFQMRDYDGERYITDDIEPTSDEARDLRREFITQRRGDWRHHHPAEKRAFDIMNKDQDRYFEDLDQLLKDVRLYQLEKQLSLEEQERRLLYDFSYPFIDIYLNYDVDTLSKFGGPDYVGDDIPESVLAAMDTNPVDVTDLSLRCSEHQGKSYELFVMVSDMKSNSTDRLPGGIRSFYVWDNTIDSRDGLLRVLHNESPAQISKDQNQLRSGPRLVKATIYVPTQDESGQCQAVLEEWEFLKYVN